MGQLNKNNKAEIPIDNFGGGYAGAKAIGNLLAAEAQDLDNIVILPGGTGFRNRHGNDQVILTNNTTEEHMTNTLGLYPFYDGTETWMVRFSLNDGVVSNQVYIVAANLADNTDDLVTSAYATASYTMSNNDQLVMSDYDNSVMAISNQYVYPLWAYINTASGITATLGVGDTPKGKVGMYWNNRCWIGNLSGNESKLQYSILLSAGVLPYASNTWTDTGSGFVEPNRGDSDELIAITPISNNVLLFFKKRSVYQVVGRSDPFAVFNLFEGVGCAGRHSLVNVDGIVYFITPDKRMLITDGDKIYGDKDVPQLAYADDLWRSVVDSRLQYTYGFRHRGRDFDWIVWLVTTTGSTNNSAIVWDLRNKCWLRNTTGFAANCAVSYPDGKAYIGVTTYGGIFKLDADSKYDDDSGGTETFTGGAKTGVSGAVAVAWKWRSDDYNLSLETITQVRRVNTLSLYSANGNLDFNYRYDGAADSTDSTKAVVPSTLKHTTQTWRPLGRGDSFGFELNNNSTVSSQISKITLVGTQKGMKDPGVV